jgi:hypothetical protein
MDDRPKGPKYPGLEHLICAALADSNFAHDLISDPASALDHKPADLHLTETEHRIASSITAASDIHDYAIKLYEAINHH